MSSPDRSAPLAIVGGSGIRDLEALEPRETVRPDTPFGRPSGPITLGRLEGVEVAFLPRHGTDHQLLPSEVPVRANVYSLAELGVRKVLGISAVGSLRESIEPGSLLAPDQLIDYTTDRSRTFFGDGLVGHVKFQDPFCADLSDRFSEVGGAAFEQASGTYVNIEGPQFSTQAESQRYRGAGGDVIGMTIAPEARLFREATICYQPLLMVTDYDAWKGEQASADPGSILETLEEAQESARQLIQRTVDQQLLVDRDCVCRRSQDDALITPPDAVPERTLRRLEPILQDERYAPTRSEVAGT